MKPRVKARPMRLKAARPGSFLNDIMFRRQEWPFLGHVWAGWGESACVVLALWWVVVLAVLAVVAVACGGGVSADPVGAIAGAHRSTHGRVVVWVWCRAVEVLPGKMWLQ